MLVEIAIIAALEREVRPLVRHWSRRALAAGDLDFPCFEREGACAVCSGIGEELARRAAVAIFAAHAPRLIVSTGLAGALDPGLRVGQVFRPATVVDLRTGARFKADAGDGILVSATSVLDRQGKQRILGAYGAQAADMEAAAVALVAEQHGCPWLAVKAISDESSFDTPSFDGFIDARGRIRTTRLVLATAIRPRRWAPLLKLGLNSARASQELCRALAHLIEEQGAAPQPALSRTS